MWNGRADGSRGTRGLDIGLGFQGYVPTILIEHAER